MNKGRSVLFEHLPKTAGSTVNVILKRYYPNSFHIQGMDPLGSLEKFKTLTPTEQKAFDLVHGHSALELEGLMHNPYLITFLRDPVDQFISQFYFIKRMKTHTSHDDVKPMASIDAYFDYSRDHFHDNLQTRVLSRNTSWIHGLKKEEEDISGDRERAMHTLRRFDMVLLTHRFDESLLLMKRKLGWTKMPVYSHINRTPQRPYRESITSLLRTNIERHQCHDMELFEYAQNRFREYASDLPDKEELKRFQRSNAWHQQIVTPLQRLVLLFKR